MEDLSNLNIGFVMTGSFCTFSKSLLVIKELIKYNTNIIPIMSYNSYQLDTKFGKSKEFISKIETFTNNKIINTIQEAEPIGPKQMTDIMCVVPASGNTIAKLANGIIDTPALMAIKSHLRNEKPIVIAISTNDGLSGSAENIGKLLNKKHFYFVPFKQDNPITKPRSLVFDYHYVVKTIKYALDKEQVQPILL